MRAIIWPRATSDGALVVLPAAAHLAQMRGSALSQRLMRAPAVALIVATATARPTRLNDDCNEAIAIVGGASPNFGAMGNSAPGNALNAGALTDGGTFAPGATYQLANTGGGQYGLYASEGTVNPTSGCANKYLSLIHI